VAPEQVAPLLSAPRFRSAKKLHVNFRLRTTYDRSIGHFLSSCLNGGQVEELHLDHFTSASHIITTSTTDSMEEPTTAADDWRGRLTKLTLNECQVSPRAVAEALVAAGHQLTRLTCLKLDMRPPPGAGNRHTELMLVAMLEGMPALRRLSLGNFFSQGRSSTGQQLQPPYEPIEVRVGHPLLEELRVCGSTEPLRLTLACPRLRRCKFVAVGLDVDSALAGLCARSPLLEALTVRTFQLDMSTPWAGTLDAAWLTRTMARALCTWPLLVSLCLATPTPPDNDDADEPPRPDDDDNGSEPAEVATVVLPPDLRPILHKLSLQGFMGAARESAHGGRRRGLWSIASLLERCRRPLALQMIGCGGQLRGFEELHGAQLRQIVVRDLRLPRRTLRWQSLHGLERMRLQDVDIDRLVLEGCHRLKHAVVTSRVGTVSLTVSDAPQLAALWLTQGKLAFSPGDEAPGDDEARKLPGFRVSLTGCRRLAQVQLTSRAPVELHLEVVADCGALAQFNVGRHIRASDADLAAIVTDSPHVVMYAAANPDAHTRNNARGVPNKAPPLLCRGRS
jgi:hypothetical protein